MNTKFFFALLAAIIALLATATSSSVNTQVAAQAGTTSGANAIVNWNVIAVRTAIQVAGQNQPQSNMYLARVQAAVYNAVVAIEGHQVDVHHRQT